MAATRTLLPPLQPSLASARANAVPATSRTLVAPLAGPSNAAPSSLNWTPLNGAGTAGAAPQHQGGLAGLWERAAGGATSVLTVAVLARLAVTSRPATRARRPGSGHPGSGQPGAGRPGRAADR